MWPSQFSRQFSPLLWVVLLTEEIFIFSRSFDICEVQIHMGKDQRKCQSMSSSLAGWKVGACLLGVFCYLLIGIVKWDPTTAAPRYARVTDPRTTQTLNFEDTKWQCFQRPPCISLRIYIISGWLTMTNTTAEVISLSRQYKKEVCLYMFLQTL